MDPSQKPPVPKRRLRAYNRSLLNVSIPSSGETVREKINHFNGTVENDVKLHPENRVDPLNLKVNADQHPTDISNHKLDTEHYDKVLSSQKMDVDHHLTDLSEHKLDHHLTDLSEHKLDTEHHKVLSSQKMTEDHHPTDLLNQKSDEHDQSTDMSNQKLDAGRYPRNLLSPLLVANHHLRNLSRQKLDTTNPLNHKIDGDHHPIDLMKQNLAADHLTDLSSQKLDADHHPVDLSSKNVNADHHPLNISSQKLDPICNPINPLSQKLGAENRHIDLLTLNLEKVYNPREFSMQPSDMNNPFTDNLSQMSENYSSLPVTISQKIDTGHYVKDVSRQTMNTDYYHRDTSSQNIDTHLQATGMSTVKLETYHHHSYSSRQKLEAVQHSGDISIPKLDTELESRNLLSQKLDSENHPINILNEKLDADHHPNNLLGQKLEEDHHSQNISSQSLDEDHNHRDRSKTLDKDNNPSNLSSKKLKAERQFLTQSLYEVHRSSDYLSKKLDTEHLVKDISINTLDTDDEDVPSSNNIGPSQRSKSVGNISSEVSLDYVWSTTQQGPITFQITTASSSSDASSFDTCLPNTSESEDAFVTGLTVPPSNLTQSQRKHGLKHMSRSTPSMSPSGSPPHSDSEGVTHVSRRTKKFLRRFRNVPSTERVINYYACAIVSDILLQGTLFITDNYFAFYSNIFGYVNKTLIPIANVSDIQKEKTAKFIPNAVGLHTFDGETFVFSSLISRDATYKFMVHMWRKSRKLTDSDIESTMHGVTEETCLDESGSNSADSAVEDCINYSDGDALKSGIATQNAVTWSKSTPLIGPGSYSAETSVSYTENNSSNTTPETCISTTSYHEVRNSIEVIGTSASENETSVDWQDNVSVSGHHHQLTSRSGTELKEGRVKWVVSANVARRVVSIGIAPFRAAKESIEEFTFQPKSFLIFLSSSLILCLLMSAAYMVYRVETLNSQLNSNSVHYGDLYEKVLQMQQKLHAATAHEIEETITTQLQQLLTVKRSLEALNFLLNTDYSQSSSNLQERTH